MSQKYKFNIVNIQDIGDDIYGVYGFWYANKCIYVGMAKDQPIKNRMAQHWARCHNDGLKLWIDAFGKELRFCYNNIENRKIDATERALISKFQPKTNIRGMGG